MNILEECRARIQSAWCRKAVLLIPESRLDEFLEAAYEYCDGKKVLDKVPWYCVPGTSGSPAVIDLDG